MNFTAPWFPGRTRTWTGANCDPSGVCGGQKPWATSQKAVNSPFVIRIPYGCATHRSHLSDLSLNTKQWQSCRRGLTWLWSTWTEALVAASMPIPRKLPFIDPVSRSMKW
eukprot:COSAG04_NODE_4716_length_1930_cov_5.558711_1_plen_110_part_00